MTFLALHLFCAAAFAASLQATPKEVPMPWKLWLDQDVVYLITPEDRRAFARLQSDLDREQFIEQFWRRRDPTPETDENEFMEEHYRRIAYANEHYAAHAPGWKTDRGRIYITYGPPDEIESHSSRSGASYPYENWRYRMIEGVGENVKVEFVDSTLSGDYHVIQDPPAAIVRPANGESSILEVGIEKPPVVIHRELEEIVSTNIRYSTLPMKVTIDYRRVTDFSVLTLITVRFQKSDLGYKTEDKSARATVGIFGRITTASRHVVNTFEDDVNVEAASEQAGKASEGAAEYQKTVPLPTGTYRLNVVAKDEVSGTLTNYEMPLNVPALP